MEGPEQAENPATPPLLGERAGEDSGQRVTPAEGPLGDEVRRLLVLAWPVVISQIGLMSMGVVDVVVSGRAGEQVLAAVGAGRNLSFAILLLGMGTLFGLDPLFSQAWGAGDRIGGLRTLGRGAVLATLLAIPVALAHFSAGAVLTALGQPVEIIPIAADYCSVRAIGVFPALMWVLLQRFLQGQGQMRIPMIAVAIGNVLNLGLDLVLVGGATLPGGFEVPAYGAIGVAWATTLVEACMALILVALTWKDIRDAARQGWALFESRAILSLLSSGLPVGFQVGLETWAFNLAGILVGTIGATALAAHSVVLTVASLTFMVPLGIGAAGSTRVGNLLGAGLRWQRPGGLAVGLSAAWMFGCGIVLTLLAEPIAQIFSEEAAVWMLTASLLPIAGAFQLFDGIQAATFGVLRGAGDIRLPAVANLIGYWLFGLPLGWWLSQNGMGPHGVWVGLALGLAAVASLLLLRLRVVARQGGVRVV